jgi:hypothetical protein
LDRLSDPISLFYQREFSTRQLLQLHAAVHSAGASQGVERLPSLSRESLEELFASASTLEFLWRQRILQPAIEVAASLQAEVPPSYARASELISVTNAIQLATVTDFTDAATAAGVTLAAIKGTALYLDRRKPRHMVDFDFLFPLDEMQLLLDVARAQEFQSGALDRRNMCLVPSSQEDLESLRQSHYELPLHCKLLKDPRLDKFFDLVSAFDCNPYLAMAGRVTVSVALDLHFNLSSDIDAGDAWQGVRPLTLGRGTIFRPQAADIVWFLAARCYHEVMQLNKYSFRQFVDVLYALCTYRLEIDWVRVLEIANKYDLHPSLYYLLSHCRDVDADLVPQHILEETRPSREGRSRFHDWGDLMPKLLGEVARARVFTIVK